MKQTYQFVGDDYKSYGEFTVYEVEFEGFYWINEEDSTIKHGPFSSELVAFNNAQGNDQ